VLHGRLRLQVPKILVTGALRARRSHKNVAPAGSEQLLGTFSQPCPRVGLAGVAEARRARTMGGNRGRGGRSVGDGRRAGSPSSRVAPTSSRAAPASTNVATPLLVGGAPGSLQARAAAAEQLAGRSNGGRAATHRQTQRWQAPSSPQAGATATVRMPLEWIRRENGRGKEKEK